MKPKSYFQSATIITTNGYSSDSTSPSPPHSPRRNRLRTYRHCRHVRRSNKSDRNTLFSTVVFRQCLRYWLVLPLFYILGLIMCSCPLSFIISPVIPGSVYRSHEIFLKVWPDIQKDNVAAKIELRDVWRYKKAKVKEEKPCPSVAARKLNEAVGGNGYLIIEANGGLNQQRSSICNAVALAGLMNATLVIPWFEYNSVWRDPSKFGDIYDEDHFIETLEGLVKVIRRVPAALMEQYDHNISNLPTIRVPAWAPISYYLKEVYPSIQNQGVIRLAPFANRLAMNIPLNLQYLRCLANYKALRFASSISTLANNLVKQMMQKSLHTDGKYVSVHLRFEEDMVAFSCCTYDGGWTEKRVMNSIREKAWRGKFRRQDREIDPGLNRISGKCPLTPVEVGMMLRGMGFDNNTAIYLASGRLYQSERHLAPLLQMFPLLYTKDSLAMPEELAPFQGYSSRLAALDYAVCLFSEVFVTTQGGNFPHFLMGHRRLLYGGHAKTVKPDKIKLVHLFHDKNISWNVMKKEMKSMLVKSNREGQAVPKDRKSRRHASIYKYPFPECRCLWGDQNITLKRINVDGLLDQQFKSML